MKQVLRHWIIQVSSLLTACRFIIVLIVHAISFYKSHNVVLHFRSAVQRGVSTGIMGKAIFMLFHGYRAARFNIFNIVKSRWMTICKFENDVVLLWDLY